MAPLLATLVFALQANAQDNIIVGATADRLDGRTGGGASILWLRPHTTGTVSAGITHFSLPDTRWTYATFGGTLRANTRTTLNAEANIGRGDDEDRGDFRYLLVRGGVTRELLARRLYGEAEWLQADVARSQNGIARIGATYLPDPRIALRASLYQSITGDDDTTLVTMRGDYDLGRMIVLAGFSAGSAAPVLLERDTDATRVREAFAGVIVNNLTIVATAGEDRQRLALSWRIPMPERGR